MKEIGGHFCPGTFPFVSLRGMFDIMKEDLQKIYREMKLP